VLKVLSARKEEREQGLKQFVKKGKKKKKRGSNVGFKND